MEYTDEDIMLVNFRDHYITTCIDKNIDLFEAGRSFTVMQNMFLNPYDVINGTWQICKEAEVLFDLLGLDSIEDLSALKQSLKNDYKKLGLTKFTITNELTGKSVNKYYVESELTSREI